MSTTTDRASAPLRAALYGRASKDPKKRGRSVEDQMIENRASCSRQGWAITGEYRDIDRSASRYARRGREDFIRMVSDIEAGHIDAIVSWESSRVQRDLEIYVKLRNLCMEHHVLWCYNGTVYDMRNANDRMVTGMMAMHSEWEADAIQARNERTARLNADRGAPHGRIPFGYKRRYDPDEGRLLGQFADPLTAPVVEDMFRRVARRQSVASCALVLMEHLPEGTDLDTARARLRNMLKNRAYIGQRGSKGQYTKAQWEPIVDEVLFWEVQAILKDPQRRTQRDVAAVHLLSGIAECGVCDSDAAAQGIRVLSGGNNARRLVQQYACRAASHVTVPREALDAYVEEALLGWLATPEAARMLAIRDDGQMEAARLRAAAARTQLMEARQLAGQFDEVSGLPKLSALSLASMEGNLQPVIDAAEAEVLRLASVADPIVGRLAGSPAQQIEAVWEDLTMSQRRHAVRMLVWVRVFKSRGKGVKDGLTADRVKLLFATQEGFQPKPLRSKAMRVRPVRESG